MKATVGLPYYAKNGVVDAPAHGRHLYFDQQHIAHSICALIHSSLFYVYYIAFSDGFHLSDNLVSSFPMSKGLLEYTELVTANESLMEELRSNALRKTIRTKDGDEITYAEFYVSKSKAIVDEIDCILAKYYGFTDEELDFIVNYDIKYRLGDELLDDDDEVDEA
jgi:hypothetical protein